MKKFQNAFILVLLFSLVTVFAQIGDRPDIPSDPFQNQFECQIPSSVIEELTQPLQESFQPLIDIAKYILGGIFGLYFLLLLTRIYYERKKVNLLKDIRFDLDHLNKHFDVPHSAHRKGFFGRLWAKLRGRA